MISGVTTPAPEPAERVGAGAQDHRDLLDAGVAGALADAVDAALDLAGAHLDAGERVGHRQPEVVVAVHRQRGVAQLRAALVEVDQEALELGGHGVADRVRDVDGGRALLDRRRDHLGHEAAVGAGGVLAGELDVLDHGARETDGVDRRGHAPGRGPSAACTVMWMSLVAMNVWMRGRSAPRTASPATLTSFSLARARAATITPETSSATARVRLEVAGRGDREAGLDDVHPEARELLADLDLLARVEVDAGRLLAVAERGVEDHHPLGGVLRCCCLLVCGHGSELLTNGASGRSGPAHPGMGVGKLPLPGEEPTKRQEVARRQRCVRDVQEHVREDTRARGATGKPGRGRRVDIPVPGRMSAT